MGTVGEAGGRRLALWEAERDASAGDRRRKAIIEHELARALEAIGDSDAADAHLRAATEADPGYRPALFARARRLGRRGEPQALAELYRAAARAARGPREQASAMVERGVLLEDRLDKGAEARRLYEQALSHDESSLIASLALERTLRRAGELAGAASVAAARAAHVSEPLLARLLGIEAALAVEDVEEAARALRAMGERGPERARALRELARLARAQGHREHLTFALGKLAELASARARGDSAGGALTTGSLPPFADEADAKAAAAVLWHEVARLRATRQEDQEGALEALDRAMQARPNDAYLLYERVDLAERLGDRSEAARVAKKLLAAVGRGPQQAAVQVRIAELEPNARGTALESAARVAPDSPAVAGLQQERLLAEASPAEAIEQLVARAETRSGPDRAAELWEAAQLAADGAADASRADALYRAAAQAADDPTPILRERYGTALRLEASDEVVAEAAEALLGADLDDAERGALRFALHRRRGEDPEALRDALADPSCAAWAADVARLRGAACGDVDLLADAHRALADRADDGGAVAHLCAAGRAFARADRLADAAEVLRAALDRASGHPYATALLEEVLRARGDLGEVAELLRAAARASSTAHAEALALRAGAAAEQAGLVEVASALYRESAAREGASVAPLRALERLSRRHPEQLDRATVLERLASQEKPAGGWALALGAHLALDGGAPDIGAARLRAAMQDEAVGGAAAALLLCLPEQQARHPEALERLLRDCQGLDAAALRRALASARASQGAEAETILSLCDEVVAVHPDDRWMRWLAVRHAFAAAQTRPSARADALEGLAGTTSDGSTSAELSLLALCVRSLAEGADEGALAERARSIADAAPGSLAAAIALEHAGLASRDALAIRLEHTTDEARGTLEAALGRAELAEGDATAARTRLLEVLDREPDDLASLEALAVAAGELGDDEALVRACEGLAAHAAGNARARLLEEAGLRLDALGRADQAEERLRAAFDADPTRKIPFERLRERYRARDEVEPWLALVTTRAGVVDDPDGLVELLREQAQLRQRAGKLDGTVEALSNVLLVEPADPRGHALLADTHVRQQSWQDAAEALRELASLGLPDAIRCDARIAAAGIAAERLGDPAAALADLKAVEDTGLFDVTVYLRMGLLAEQVGDPEAAMAAYEAALAREPTEATAARGLVALAEGDRRDRAVQRYEQALRERLEQDPTDAEALRELVRAAQWVGARDRELCALAALGALGVADERERQLCRELDAERNPTPSGTLDEAAHGTLGEDAIAGPLRELAALAAPHIAAMDGSEPGAFDVGRRELVKPASPHDVRDAVQQLAECFGGEPHERFYAGGSDPAAVVLAPQADRAPSWIVGGDVSAPLRARARFAVAASTTGARLGTLFLLDRSAEQGLEMLRAVAAAADASLGGEPSPELVGRVKKALPRKARKAIAELAAQVDPSELEAFVRQARIAMLRAGALAAGELSLALRTAAVDAGAPTGTEEARALLRSWLDPAHAALRTRLGIAVADGEPAAATPIVDTPDAAPALPEVSVQGLRARVTQATEGDATAGGEEREAAVEAPTAGGAGAEPAQERSSEPRARVAVLEGLAARAEGWVRARVASSIAELLHGLGDEQGAQRWRDDAYEACAEDVLALRRARRDAMRRGELEQARKLLGAETDQPIAPEERAFAWLLEAMIGLHEGEPARATDAAQRAQRVRPQSTATALLLAAVALDAGRATDVAHLLERAADAGKDDRLGAALRLEVAGLAERGGDLQRARLAYRRTAEADAGAVDAWLGLARCARAQGEAAEAAGALHRAADVFRDAAPREALLYAAARLWLDVAGSPSDAAEAVHGTRTQPAAELWAEAAEATGDGAGRIAALEACAQATRRTDQALALVQLAETRAAHGDADGAWSALREAGRADATLPTIRVAHEELARRMDDLAELARATRSGGGGTLAAAARVGLRDPAELERRLLARASGRGEDDRCADLLALDVEVAAGAKARALVKALGKAPRDGELLAVAGALNGEGDDELLRELLDRARETSEDAAVELVASRWRATLAPAAEAARIWLEEANAAEGPRAAFAATMAGRLLAGSDGAPETAFTRALEAQRDYPPALWAQEARARAAGDGCAIAAMLSRRAEAASDPLEAATRLVRAAAAHPDGAATPLTRAQQLVPEDPVLADMLARCGDGVDAPVRAAALEASAAGPVSAEHARAAILRAARILAEADEPARAAAACRPLADDDDPFATHLLDRVEPAAGETDRAAARLRRRAQDAQDDVSRALSWERLAELSIGTAHDPEAGIEALEAVLERYPGHVASLRTLERTYMERADDAGLARIAERFGTMGVAADAGAWVRLAVRLLERASPKPDRRGIDRVLRTAFDYVEVDLWLARRVERHAREAEDERLLVQALAELAERLEEPDERASYELALAEVSARVRSPVSAAGRLAELAEGDTGHPLFDELLAERLIDAREHVEAAQALERAAKAAKVPERRSELLRRAAEVWEGPARDPERAADLLCEAARLEPTDAELLAKLQAMLPKQGRTETLAELVEAALAKARTDRRRQAELQLLLADLRQQLGDLASAKKQLRLVASTNPGDTDALTRLVSVCRSEGDAAGAVDALQKLARLVSDPNERLPVLVELGDLCAEMGRASRAKAAWQEALQLVPNDPELQQRIASLGPR